jgi:Holliday junction resolvase RusA-like endonuclease
MTLTLAGHCPTKKNGKRALGGRVVMDREIAGQITRLMWQAREQWAGKPPIQQCRITATFYVRDGRADLDGKYTTMQDVLVAAGVIRNDSIARVAGFCCEAIVDSNERVVVEITPMSAAAVT